MGQRLKEKLECSDCGTIYLRIPENVQLHFLIQCNSCARVLGRWSELTADCNPQRGENGVFEMHDGQIIRRE
ncbi:hypothetical protein B5P45_12725 [Phyllobacterium zundukense]|uniref:Uncharacterized protein n=1 Tax=Phyllobacterium zundukense TaxID=1867719 RepID=A0A2N9VYA4_9HYPH|nr:hypothetical protein BLM14_24985 [Phyllobacterium zundukense]PIO44472.1 hypothetical protein B5P45_12725 [Phyllobacterium zundukense]